MITAVQLSTLLGERGYQVNHVEGRLFATDPVRHVALVARSRFLDWEIYLRRGSASTTVWVRDTEDAERALDEYSPPPFLPLSPALPAGMRLEER